MSEKLYKDQRNPFECRGCGSHEFKAEITGGRIDGEIQVTTPQLENLNPGYDVDHHQDIIEDVTTIDWGLSDVKDFVCAKCNGKDIMTVEEALDNKAQFKADVAAGRIFEVSAGQLDIFGGMVEKPYWRRATRIDNED